jgi:hypothetical protein
LVGWLSLGGIAQGLAERLNCAVCAAKWEKRENEKGGQDFS